MTLSRIFHFFETWIDVFREPRTLQPPTSVAGFLWHYLGQSKAPFAAMLVVGGLAPLVEAGLFYFVGRLVDLLDGLPEQKTWQIVWDSAGYELLFMAFVVMIARTLVVALTAMLDGQTVTPHFYNLVRWQAHRHVSRQSYTFFQNDFAGRIANKVWQAGQATGDLLGNFIEVIWFVIVYSITTLALVGTLDWRLAALVIIWMIGFAILARIFLPSIRKYAEATAEAGSMVNGRIVDSYSNIQALKLFSPDGDDSFIRDGFEQYLGAMHPFMRRLSTLRILLTALSGFMITVIAGFAVHLWVMGSITVGGVAFTLSLMLRLNMLLGRLMMQLNAILRNLGVLENSKALIARPLALVDKPGATELKVTGGAIRVENVDFHYGKGSGVLDGINLTIKPGEKVGLVGPSGRRQDDPGQSDPAALRPRRRTYPDRRPGHRRSDADVAAPKHRRGQPGHRAVPPVAARQYPAWHAGSERRQAHLRPPKRPRRTSSSSICATSRGGRATTPMSANAASNCRAGSGSASRLRA